MFNGEYDYVTNGWYVKFESHYVLELQSNMIMRCLNVDMLARIEVRNYSEKVISIGMISSQYLQYPMNAVNF